MRRNFPESPDRLVRARVRGVAERADLAVGEVEPEDLAAARGRADVGPRRDAGADSGELPAREELHEQRHVLGLRRRMDSILLKIDEN